MSAEKREKQNEKPHWQWRNKKKLMKIWKWQISIRKWGSFFVILFMWSWWWWWICFDDGIPLFSCFSYFCVCFVPLFCITKQNIAQKRVLICFVSWPDVVCTHYNSLSAITVNAFESLITFVLSNSWYSWYHAVAYNIANDCHGVSWSKVSPRYASYICAWLYNSCVILFDASFNFRALFSFLFVGFGWQFFFSSVLSLQQIHQPKTRIRDEYQKLPFDEHLVYYISCTISGWIYQCGRTLTSSTVSHTLATLVCALAAYNSHACVKRSQWTLEPALRLICKSRMALQIRWESF